MSFDPNYRPPGQNVNMQGGGGGMNIPPNNQMRQPMYNPQQQQHQMPSHQQQQQHQQQRFQNQQMPPGVGGGGPPVMMQQQQTQMRYPRITDENFKQYFDKLPLGLKEKFNTLPQDHRVPRLQQLYETNFKRHMMEQQQMRMNAPGGGGGGFPPPQPQQQQQQQQRFSSMQSQGNADVQGGFIPAGQEQKPPIQHQIPFPGPGPQGQKRKGPSPGVAPAAAASSATPFPGPGPTAQNPSTVPTGPSSQPPPPQQPSLHQSQSQPSFNIQASQPPPQNPPGVQQQDLKFGGGGGNQQIKAEPQMQSSLPQQQQQQFGIPNSQQLQFQPLSSSQSQPSLLNPNQPKFEFQNQPRPEMTQQQQQQPQQQPMQTDFGPPSQQQPQMMQQNQPQQGFNVPPSQSIGQQQQQPAMNQNQQMGQQQMPPQHSFQPPPQQQQSTPQPQPQQQLLQPRPPGQMPQQQQQQQMGQPQPQQQQQQQTFAQGPSPAVHAGVASVGRVPTPSTKSVMSGGNIPQDIVNSKEYQETFSRLKQCRETCYRILQRMRLEQDSAVAGMQKTIEIIEGKRNVSIELMEKLIKNINSIHSRYDVTNGLRKAVEIIKKAPTIDMSSLIADPYEKYKHLRISAPKEYYKEADDAKNDREQQQYIKKRMKWFEENNFWDGTEPTPYPWKRSIRQYTSEKLEEINKEFNEKITAPFDESVQPYIPKDPNNPNKTVTFNAEVDVLIRVDAKPDDRGEENEYDEKESDESDDDGIVVEGDEEFEAFENGEEKPEYENLEHFESINNGNYEQHAFYDINGELQYTVQHPLREEAEQKQEPDDSEIAPPPAKRIKVEEVSPKAVEQLQYTNPPYDFNYGSYAVQPAEIVTVPGPTHNFEFNPAENMEGGGDPQTLEDMEVAQSYEAYLQRQQQASYYESLAMNTQMVQDELYSNAITMPNENYYQTPVMEPPPHEKLSDDPPPDCPYSCCAPYEIDSIMGKPAILPKAAASELRKFRHRVDYENQPLSEHSPFYAIIINPTKANSKIKFPELRINIPKNYPAEAIDFQIVKPSSIHGKAAKSFYEKLEKRMFERRLCGISLHTIGEVVSAFRFCVEIVHKKRDILDFSHLNIFL